MKLAYTDDELNFREEIRSFLQANLSPDLRLKLLDGDPMENMSKEDLVEWTRVLNRKGWSVPHWPVEFGGTGWGPIKQCIFWQETQGWPAPPPVPFGLNLVGPVIFTFGSQDQKRRFLPRIANLDDWWCQGFSEPGAGSDLAALNTRAVRDGDRYIVNGQKTWTTLAHHANWMFCLVRTQQTAKKQDGISFLLIEMNSPGIEIRPITTIDGARQIHEVFLTNVSVPVENLVGDENKGWSYTKFLLGNERAMVARVGISKQRLARVRELARLESVCGRPLIEDQAFRERLAAVEVELKALEFTQLRASATEARNGKQSAHQAAASILKLKGSEIQQTISELLLEVAGPCAMVFEPNSDERFGLPRGYAESVAAAYFNTRKVTIYGGTSEIQKNIIAKIVLGI